MGGASADVGNRGASAAFDMSGFAMGGQSAFTLAGQPMGMGQQTMPMMQSQMYGQPQPYAQGMMSSQGFALTPQQQQQYMMQQQQMQQMYQAQPQQLQGQYPAQPSASRQGSMGPRSVAM